MRLLRSLLAALANDVCGAGLAEIDDLAVLNIHINYKGAAAHVNPDVLKLNKTPEGKEQAHGTGTGAAGAGLIFVATFPGLFKDMVEAYDLLLTTFFGDNWNRPH